MQPGHGDGAHGAPGLVVDDDGAFYLVAVGVVTKGDARGHTILLLGDVGHGPRPGACLLNLRMGVVGPSLGLAFGSVSPHASAHIVHLGLLDVHHGKDGLTIVPPTRIVNLAVRLDFGRPNVPEGVVDAQVNDGRQVEGVRAVPADPVAHEEDRIATLVEELHRDEGGHGALGQVLNLDAGSPAADLPVQQIRIPSLLELLLVREPTHGQQRGLVRPGERHESRDTGPLCGKSSYRDAPTSVLGQSRQHARCDLGTERYPRGHAGTQEPDDRPDLAARGDAVQERPGPLRPGFPVQEACACPLCRRYGRGLHDHAPLGAKHSFPPLQQGPRQRFGEPGQSRWL